MPPHVAQDAEFSVRHFTKDELGIDHSQHPRFRVPLLQDGAVLRYRMYAGPNGVLLPVTDTYTLTILDLWAHS